MAIFNVSIHKRGVHLIENDRPLLQLLKRNVSDFNNELKYISLKLLQSITHNIQDRTVLSTVLEEVLNTDLRNELFYYNPINNRSVLPDTIRQVTRDAREKLQRGTKYNSGNTQESRVRDIAATKYKL